MAAYTIISETPGKSSEQSGGSPQLNRRATLLMSSLAGAAALLSGVPPSKAAFGDPANVFEKVSDRDPFAQYVGEGFALVIPSKWTPSKELEHPGTVFR